MLTRDRHFAGQKSTIFSRSSTSLRPLASGKQIDHNDSINLPSHTTLCTKVIKRIGCVCCFVAFGYQH